MHPSCLSMNLSIHLFTPLLVKMSVHPESITLLSIPLSSYLFICLSTFSSVHPSIHYLLIHLSIFYQFVYLSIVCPPHIHLSSFHLSTNLPTYLSFYLSFHPIDPIYTDTYLSVQPSIYLSYCVTCHLHIQWVSEVLKSIKSQTKQKADYSRKSHTNSQKSP